MKRASIHTMHSVACAQRAGNISWLTQGQTYRQSNIRLQLGTSILIQQIIHTLDPYSTPSRQHFTTEKTLTQLSSLNHAEHGTIHSTAMLFHEITRKPKARQAQKNRTAAEIRLTRRSCAIETKSKNWRSCAQQRSREVKKNKAHEKNQPIQNKSQRRSNRKVAVQ